MLRSSSTRRGFTLIEVLVALAIVSIGMLVVIQAVSQTANNSAYLRDKTLAHWAAMNQLTMMRISQTVPATGTSGGEVEMAGQRFKWTAEVTQTPIDSMLRIDVGVRAADGDENSQLATVTGFIGTKISKPGTLVAAYTPTVTLAAGTITTTGTPTPTTPGTTRPTTPPANAPGVPQVPPINAPGSPTGDPTGPLVR